MPNVANLTRPGQIVNGADAREIFMEQYAGEVLRAFMDETKVMDRHKVRHITEGKSANFPATWKATAYEHTPGEHLTPQKIMHGERKIFIDKRIVAPIFTDSLDELISHYENRAEYGEQSGRVLAEKMDANVMRSIVAAARVTAGGETIQGYSPVGTVLSDLDLATSVSVLASKIFEAQIAFDGNKVPEGGRAIYVKPLQYWGLIQDPSATAALDRDYGGSGVYATGVLKQIGGLDIVKITNMPTDDGSGETETKYQVDLSSTVAFASTPDAVGTVKLLDLHTDSWEDKDRRGHMIVSEYACGHGILRPECAVEFLDT